MLTHTQKWTHRFYSNTHRHTLPLGLAQLHFIYKPWMMNKCQVEWETKKKKKHPFALLLDFSLLLTSMYFLNISQWWKRGLGEGDKTRFRKWRDTIWDTSNDPVYAEFCLGFVFHSFFFILPLKLLLNGKVLNKYSQNGQLSLNPA